MKIYPFKSMLEKCYILADVSKFVFTLTFYLHSHILIKTMEFTIFNILRNW